MRTETAWGPWDPFDLAELTGLFRDCPALWWIGGGYAIEAFVGHAYREHGDIDAGFFRPDCASVQRYLDGWDVQMADPPGSLRFWAVDEQLPARAHDIWVRPAPGEPFRFQLMVDERDGDDWVYRRDAGLRRPIQSLTWMKDGVRYLAPEIQLLYKSRGLRPKDHEDFERAAPLLSAPQRRWLAAGLRAADAGHPWLAGL